MDLGHLWRPLLVTNASLNLESITKQKRMQTNDGIECAFIVISDRRRCSSPNHLIDTCTSASVFYADANESGIIGVSGCCRALSCKPSRRRKSSISFHGGQWRLCHLRASNKKWSSQSVLRGQLIWESKQVLFSPEFILHVALHYWNFSLRALYLIFWNVRTVNGFPINIVDFDSLQSRHPITPRK